MSRHALLTWLTTAVLVGTTASAGAQGRTGQGGTGFGGSSVGSGFGSSAFGTSSSGGSLGSTGFGSSGFGTTGLGSGFGTSGIGSSGFGTGGSGSSAFGSQGFGQSAYGAQGGQSFVGRDSGDMQGLFNQIGRGSNQFFQQLNRTMGGGNQNRNRPTGQQENAELPVRVQLNVAFDHARPRPSVLAATVRSRLEQVLAGRNIAAPQVEVDGDTVILRGTAQSESQRLVIEKLVSLEPGVSTVENQLTIADAIPSEPNPPETDN